MANMNLSVVTPTGAVVETEILEATVPGSAGEFGVYPDHQPALIMLGGGLVTYQGVEETGEFLIRGGVAEVSADSLLIITDHALSPEDADADEARELLEAAEAALESVEKLDDSFLARVRADRGYAESVLKLSSH